MKTELEFLSSMERSFRSGEYDQLISLEADFYQKFIKSVESKENHERCFSAYENTMLKYGDVLRELSSGIYVPRGVSILYFLPSLDNDLAHIEHLYNILINHAPDNAFSVYVAGFAARSDSVGSRRLIDLARKGKIKLISVKQTHKGIVDLVRFVKSNGIGIFAVYSIPLLLSAFVRAFGSDRVAWIPTKFRLDCFAELQHRVGWGWETDEELQQLSGKWRVSPVAFPANDLPVFDPRFRSRTKLVSINREEKIAARPFLDVIVRILKSRPTCHFYWTGRSERADIYGFFLESGVVNQTSFIGWVDPMQVLGDYDIFLDTYGLSGSVAAKAFAAGMPSACFCSAGAWPELFESKFVSDTDFASARTAISDLVSDSSDAYVATVQSLIDSASQYEERSILQRRLGVRYFCDVVSMYELHMKLMKRIAVFGKA